MNGKLAEPSSSVKVSFNHRQCRGLLQKLNLLQLKGCLQAHKYGHHMKLFQKLPRRLAFRLADLVTESVLQSGHVFLGFTKDGQFVISYTLQVEADEQTAYPFYVYRLHWWLFVPYRPLKKVSEVHLFGNQEITQDLKIAVCQWPTDETRILIYGCSASTVQDAVQCYITITAAPPVQSCAECTKLKNGQNNEGDSLPSSGTAIPKQCLQHSFIIHTKYILVPPFPPFNPSICMKMDKVVLINTGDNLVFLYANLENKIPNPSTHHRMSGKVSACTDDCDLETAAVSPANISADSQLSCNFIKSVTGDCLEEAVFEHNINAYPDYFYCCHNMPSCHEISMCTCSHLPSSPLLYSTAERVILSADSSDHHETFKRKVDKSSSEEDLSSLGHQQAPKMQQKRTKISSDDLHPLSPKERYENSLLNEFSEHLAHNENVSAHGIHREKIKYCMRHQHIQEYKTTCFNHCHPECEPSDCFCVKINDTGSYSPFPITSPDLHSPGGLYNAVVFSKQKRNCIEKLEDMPESHNLSGEIKKKKPNSVSCSVASKHISSQGSNDTDDKILSKKNEPCLFRTEISKWLRTNEESVKENISPSGRNCVMIFGSGSKQVVKDKEQKDESFIREGERYLDGIITSSPNQCHKSCNTVNDITSQQSTNIWCVTQSVSCFAKDKEDSVPGSSRHHTVFSDEESSCAEYHNTLQLEVYGYGYIPLKSIHQDSISKEKGPILMVHQLAFDIEQYAHEMAQKLCAEAGKKYLAFNDYDVQVIDLCPMSGTAVVLVLMLVQATVGKKGVAKAIRSSERQLYQTGFKFKWNITTGVYSVIDTEELKSVDHYDRIHDRPYRWNPAQKAVQCLQKEWYIPQSFTSSVNVLTNEAVFKGLPLRILWAPTHHVAIYL